MSFNSMLLAISGLVEEAGQEKVSADLGGESPALFLVKLILNQMIPVALSNRTQTSAASNLFVLLNKLLAETGVAKDLERLAPGQELLWSLDSMIR